ncbi:hypothetical protein McanMca71_004449 [Microsporum canis]
MTIDPSSLPKCILIQITRNPTNLYRKLNPYLVLNIMKIPFTTLLASVAFFLATTEAVEPCVYVGISSSEYNETLNIKTALEYRPTYVSAYANAYGEARYNVIFEKPSATPAWHTNFGYNANDFDKTFEEYKKDGFRPTLVEGYYSGGERHYASIWEKNNENIAWEERRNMSEDEFTSWYNDFVGKGYTLRHLSGYSFNDQEQFAGVFEKKPSPPRKAYVGLTADEYRVKSSELKSDDYYAVHISTYTAGGKAWFAGIFEKMDDKKNKPEVHIGWAYARAADATWDTIGHRLISMDGYVDNGEKFVLIFKQGLD